jgi:type I restriction enzyme S subunit
MTINQPKLRFKKFDAPYKKSILGEIADIAKGKGLSKASLDVNGKYKCILYGQLFKTYGDVIENVVSRTNQGDAYLSKSGDVLMPASDVTPYGLATASALMVNDVKLGGDMNVIRPIIEINSQYLSYLINRTKKPIIRLVVGATVKHVYGKELKKISFNIPTASQEQVEISNFLMKTDEKIGLLEQKFALLKQYKKGVVQNIFSQEIRFKDEVGNDFPAWTTERIDYFVERTNEAVDVQPDKSYRQIGIRSHGKGIFHKEEVKGHVLGKKRVFWVHPDAFVVNIVFAWEHAVAKTSEQESGFIASHRFPMFIPKKNRVDLRFFTLFFMRKKGKHLLGLASPGGAGRNKTLGQSNFAELKVTFPCLEEQIKISDFYEVLDKKVKLVEKQIEQAQSFKKALLQQMFV